MREQHNRWNYRERRQKYPVKAEHEKYALIPLELALLRYGVVDVVDVDRKGDPFFYISEVTPNGRKTSELFYCNPNHVAPLIQPKRTIYWSRRIPGEVPTEGDEIVFQLFPPNRLQVRDMTFEVAQVCIVQPHKEFISELAVMLAKAS